jgi:formylglycine-generating enzyme required for sulfatase activity
MGITPAASSLADDHPAMCVRYEDARAYCGWAGKRLLTEVEWEVAARGALGRRFPWGGDWELGRANTGRFDHKAVSFRGDGSDGYLETAPVNGMRAGGTPEGVLNLAGNVAEWVEDWYGERAYRDLEDTWDPRGPSSGEKRVVRGGGWNAEAYHVRGANRYKSTPTRRSAVNGIRCGWSMEGPPDE